MPDGQVDKPWVEIVRVRLSDMKDRDRVRLLFLDLHAGRVSGHPFPVETVLFKSGDIPTDWSIHLVWDHGRDEATQTPLGAWLCSLLSEIGLVNHSTWVRYI